MRSPKWQMGNGMKGGFLGSRGNEGELLKLRKNDKKKCILI